MEKKRFRIPDADEKLLPKSIREETICKFSVPARSKITEITNSNDREMEIIKPIFGDGWLSLF